MNKTQKNKASVKDFLEAVEHPKRKEDALRLFEIMNEICEEPASMWGSSLVGYGSYHYKYESGREGDWFLCGFSPRKQNLTVYVMPSFDRHPELLSKLGKHKLGKSCLYINRLEDVDLEILNELIKTGYKAMKRRYS